MKKTLAIMLVLLCLGSALAGEVVTTGNVNLRVGPGLDFDIITAVPEGIHLEYLDESSVDARGVEWYRVASDVGEAWISSRYSRLTDAEPVARVEDTGDYVEVLEKYRTDLIAAAGALGLSEYASVVSEVPNRYFNDALTLAGNEEVECIIINAPGYTLAGAGVGMDAGTARAALLASGLTLVGDSATRMDFEYPGENAWLNAIGDFGGVVYVTLTNGIVSGIDLESYTS